MKNDLRVKRAALLSGKKMVSIAMPAVLVAGFLVAAAVPGRSVLPVATPGVTQLAQLPSVLDHPDRENPTDRLYLAGIDDPQEVDDFLEAMRAAERQGDRRALVELVHFPFTTYDAGTLITTYHTPEALLLDFDQVFTPLVMEAIEHAQYDELFVNSQGAMIGNGEIWFMQYPDGIRIKAING